MNNEKNVILKPKDKIIRIELIEIEESILREYFKLRNEEKEKKKS